MILNTNQNWEHIFPLIQIKIQQLSIIVQPKLILNYNLCALIHHYSSANKKSLNSQWHA